MTETHLPAVRPAGQLPAVAEPVDPARDPYMVYLATLGNAESRRTMADCLDRIAAMVHPGATSGAGQPWHRLRYEYTARIRAMLVHRMEHGDDAGVKWSPAHVNKHLVALRRVLREAWRLGLMTAEDMARASDVQNVKATRLPAGRHVARSAFGAILAACDEDDTPAGLRDAALLATLYTSGMRREELAAVELGDYDPAERSLRILGKRDKERQVFITEDAAARVEAWLGIRGTTPGALFPPLYKGGRARTGPDGTHPRMTGQAVRKILRKRITQAEVKNATPHDFRRTFIGELLDAGVDLATAQDLAGHSTP
ncbi:tyrosine-type recombinase/integrase, partial [Spongiactinospora gelatinilytica]|uniref:tyrosine-type recombinase/integrase n=1 Tax=Spongiactinospora gelatinilytica TaxID=2666298 RepID=UPI001F272A25